jgi:hypothetical protein
VPAAVNETRDAKTGNLQVLLVGREHVPCTPYYGVSSIKYRTWLRGITGPGVYLTKPKLSWVRYVRSRYKGGVRVGADCLFRFFLRMHPSVRKLTNGFPGKSSRARAIPAFSCLCSMAEYHEFGLPCPDDNVA